MLLDFQHLSTVLVSKSELNCAFFIMKEIDLFWLSSGSFFREGAEKIFLGGAPSKFSGATDSGGGASFF